MDRYSGVNIHISNALVCSQLETSYRGPLLTVITYIVSPSSK